jgi:hypothetical protein
MKIIHQTWITDNNQEPPEFIKNQINKLRLLYPDYEYKLYNDEDIKKIIHEFFGENLLNLYERIIPYAFKSDIARICLLYLYGGFYWDVTLCPDEKVEFDDDVVLIHVSKEIKRIINGFMFFKKNKHIILKDVLSKIENNITFYQYTQDPFTVTGPSLLGEIVYENYSDLKIKFGNVLSGDYQKKAYIDGRFFFNLKPHYATSDLSKIGAKGTNNYISLWENKKIYNYEKKNKNKKFLVFTNHEGNDNEFLTWFSNESIEYDRVINYNGNDENKNILINSCNPEYILKNNGGLWKNVSLHMNLFENYDYILIIRDSISVNIHDIEDTFNKISSNKWEGCQWSKTKNSKGVNTPFYIQNKNLYDELVNYVEPHFVFLKKELLCEIITYYNNFKLNGDGAISLLCSNILIKNRNLNLYVINQYSFYQKNDDKDIYSESNDQMSKIINNNRNELRNLNFIENKYHTWDRINYKFL